VRTVTALLALVVLLVGVPWVILQWGAWDDFLGLVRDPSRLLLPDDGHLVAAILTALGALLWIVLAWSIILEGVDMVRSRRSGHDRAVPVSRLFRGPRRLVRPLVAAVFALAALGSTAHASAEQPAPPALVQVVPAELIPAESAPVDDGQAAGEAGSGVVHIVVPGDSLWSIAERAYGDGQEWTRIAEANQDVILDVPDFIQVGTRLRIPPRDPPAVAPDCSDEEIVTVEKGDSLWSIAQRDLGDPQQWVEIAQANQSLISDPDRIEPGWKLTLPCQVVDDTAAPNSVPTSEDGPIGDETDPAANPDGTGDVPSGDVSLPTDPVPAANPPMAPGADEEAADSQSATSSESSAEMGPADGNGSAVVQRVIGAGAVLAGGMALMVRRRRLSQLRARPVGRRILHPGDSGRRLEAAMSAAGSEAVASLPHARVDYLVQEFSGSAGTGRADPTTGMSTWQESDAALTWPDAWTVLGEPDDALLKSAQDDPAGPVECPEPPAEPLAMELLPANVRGVAVCLGEDEQGEIVIADVAGAKPFLVCGDPADTVSVMTGIAMGVAVDEWSATVTLHVVSDGNLFATFEAVERHRTFDEAMDSLRLMIADRRTFIGNRLWDDLRGDPNCGEAWRPIVYCFLEPVNDDEFWELAECLAGSDVGIAVLVPLAGEMARRTEGVVSGRLDVESLERAVLQAGNRSLRPLTLMPAPPLADVLQTTASQVTLPAWWSADGGVPRSDTALTGGGQAGMPVSPDVRIVEGNSFMIPMERPRDDSAAVSATTFSHPTLKMLGPILMEAARGEPPPRAERACMECCGWLLEHPGTTATAMTQGLLVAEGTRRSNMSRLRGWLGRDQEGKPYLPEAYSGRIWLDAAVTSDWQRLCLLIAGGVERADTARLIQALELVRGAPLADAAPGQWHWAEEIRTDMVSIVRDIGVIATKRCLDEGDIDQARWAASRALVAAPEDELLLCARVQTEHAAGNRLEVERLVAWITRNARNLGIDLLPDTATVLQDVLGGRARLGVRPAG